MDADAEKDQEADKETAKTKKTRKPHKVKFHRTLSCRLTKDELLESGKTLANAHERINRKEEELKSVKSQIQSEIDLEEAKIGRHSAMLQTGIEYREVQCERTIDYVSGMVTEIRLDSLEQLDHRKIAGSEMQMDLAQ